MARYGETQIVDNLSIAIVSLSVESLSLAGFEKKLEYFVIDAKANAANIILFPEYTFAPIISVCNNDLFAASLATEKIMHALNTKYQISICACGIYNTNGVILNQAYYITNGNTSYQAKINLIKSEKSFGLSHGQSLNIITLGTFKLAILICYDIEFPELTRLLVKNGVNLILVPSYTIDSYGANRVDFCVRARTIENHVYIAKACLVGTNGHETESPFGKGLSAVYSPCDVPFAEDGIVATANTDKTDSICYGTVSKNTLNKMKNLAATEPFEDYLKLDISNINVFLKYLD